MDCSMPVGTILRNTTDCCVQVQGKCVQVRGCGGVHVVSIGTGTEILRPSWALFALAARESWIASRI